MRKFATLLAVVMVAVFSAGVIVAADAPEKITIKEIQKTKAPVQFSHKVHADKIGKCQECHHKDAAGKEQKCSTCHKAKKEGDAVEYKEAMHGKCKGCHQKEKKGPTKCDDCHKK
ncbi:MAG TPA: cytochrome c3 family protein [Candidatus Deferrimicrobiaceae bacterium]